MGTLADLEKKVSQLFIVGVPDLSLGAQEHKLLERIAPGGYIHFAHNIESPRQIIELNNDLQKISEENSWHNLPAWNSIDQEGGRVQRFKEPGTIWPSAKEVGDHNSTTDAFDLGQAIGAELKALGYNLNFAPVVDIPKDWNQPALGDRCFSTEVEKVAALGSALARGIQKSGVLAVAKHFPGHGTADADSHVSLPQCDLSLDELRERDWIPFKRCVRARIEGVLTAHVLYPKIDAERPATLSRKFIQDYLRTELRFNNLVFTDDMGMGALTNKYSLEESVFLALEAGCDQILLCHNIDELETIWTNVVRAYETNTLPKAKLDESIARIQKQKAKWIQPVVYADYSKAEKVLGSQKHLDLASVFKK